MTNIYTIFDEVAQVSGQVFAARTDAQAGRIFQQCMKNSKDINSADFSLWRLCAFQNEDKPVLLFEKDGDDYSLPCVRVDVKLSPTVSTLDTELAESE